MFPQVNEGGATLQRGLQSLLLQLPVALVLAKAHLTFTY